MGYLKCWKCGFINYVGSIHELGSLCRSCGEGQMQWIEPFQKTVPVSPNLKRRYFKCEKCKKVYLESELDRMNPYQCLKGNCKGKLAPI
ncbi:MAG: hypothetical protein ACOYVF_10700 [Candidatus Zixiibacteriota bacterium]